MNRTRRQSMPSSKLKDVLRNGVVAIVALVLCAGIVRAQDRDRDRIRIPVGRGEVVTSNEDVRTVAIAEPKIADAAVGSARTVVVNAKEPGVTTRVLYAEGAHYTVYGVEVDVPNSEKPLQRALRVAETDSDASRERGLDAVGT